MILFGRPLLVGLLVIGSLFIFSSVSVAKDLGVFGRLYEIKEIDMRILIAKQLEEGAVKKVQDEVVKSTEDFYENLTDYGLRQSSITTTKWVDLTIEVNRDIQAPQKLANGSWQNKLLVAKGTRVNPLDHVRPAQNMLFFSGDSKLQVDFAIDALKKKPYNLILVMTAGNPSKFSERIKAHVYYANDALLKKFHVKYVPSLVGTGKDEHQGLLAVTRFRLPATDESILEKAWYGLEDGI